MLDDASLSSKDGKRIGESYAILQSPSPSLAASMGVEGVLRALTVLGAGAREGACAGARAGAGVATGDDAGELICKSDMSHTTDDAEDGEDGGELSDERNSGVTNGWINEHAEGAVPASDWLDTRGDTGGS